MNTSSSTQSRRLLNYSILCVLTSFVTLFGVAFDTKAQNAPDWWFDVELLIIKNKQGESKQNEVFQQNTTNKLDYSYALMNDFLQPDVNAVAQHLPKCIEFGMLESLCKPEPTFVDFLVEWLGNSKTDDNAPFLNSYEKLPIFYDGYIPYYSTKPHFLPKSSLALSSLYDDIRSDKTMTPLLHVAWRQPVAEGEENAPFHRIQAGENLNYQIRNDVGPIRVLFSNDVIDENVTRFDKLETNLDISSAEMNLENPVTSEPNVPASLVTQIQQNLTAPENVKYTVNTDQLSTEEISNRPIFEIDGGLKVFIKYYSGVPYLHVVGDILFASKDPNTGQIAFYEFQQRRRVISKQIHYFDHPYFGLVVTLTRHRRSVPQE